MRQRRSKHAVGWVRFHHAAAVRSDELSYEPETFSNAAHVLPIAAGANLSSRKRPSPSISDGPEAIDLAAKHSPSVVPYPQTTSPGPPDDTPSNPRARNRTGSRIPAVRLQARIAAAVERFCAQRI